MNDYSNINVTLTDILNNVSRQSTERRLDTNIGTFLNDECEHSLTISSSTSALVWRLVILQLFSVKLSRSCLVLLVKICRLSVRPVFTLPVVFTPPSEKKGGKKEKMLAVRDVPQILVTCRWPQSSHWNRQIQFCLLLVTCVLLSWRGRVRLTWESEMSWCCFQVLLGNS